MSVIEIRNSNFWRCARGRRRFWTARSVVPSRSRDFYELTKPRMNLLVIITTLVGYFVAARDPVDWSRLAPALIGTALTAAGASVLNQLVERRSDRRMARTAHRPLPAGRVRPIEAAIFAAALTFCGMAVLVEYVNGLTALLAAITLAIYILIYTPAKRFTTLCTLIGAVPGALPVMMGCTAATGTVGAAALILFAILFVWQIPHFLAIAILHHQDYGRGGFKMLSIDDEKFRKTGREILLYTSTLVLLTVLPSIWGLAGMSYCAVAIVLGILFLCIAVDCVLNSSQATARRLFAASIAYLPLLLGALVLNKVG
jgi:heme o synthase